MLQFVIALPLADVWQDAAWREQQRRLLTAQFGPREVAALGAATHSALAGAAADATAAGGRPLAWVQARLPCSGLLRLGLLLQRMPVHPASTLPHSAHACQSGWWNWG